MAHCPNCNSELDKNWVSCPHCSQSTRIIVASNMEVEMTWYAALFYYSLATVSILLGLFLDLIFNSRSPNWNIDLINFCMGLQILFLVLGIYLLVSTLNKRKKS